MKRGVELIEKDYLKKDLPTFKVGDEIRVFQRIQEGEKSRLQAFEGVVIRRRGRGMGETFTLLRRDQSDSVEKVFAVRSPFVEKITVLQAANRKLKKARLYHLRHKGQET